MKGGIGQLMQQAKRMQAELKAQQEQAKTTLVTGEAGGGLVKVTATCAKTLTEVHIDEAAMREDNTLLSDLVLTAVNQAFAQADKVMAEGMSSVTGGMNLPAGLDLGKLGL